MLTLTYSKRARRPEYLCVAFDLLLHISKYLNNQKDAAVSQVSGPVLQPRISMIT